MHGSRWRREETRPVGPARAAQPRRLSPTLLTAVKSPQKLGVHDVNEGVVLTSAPVDMFTLSTTSMT